MLNRFEFRQRLATDALAGGIGGDEVGKLLFEVEQLMIKPVVSLVANGGLGLDVIGVIMRADFIGEFGVTGFGFVMSHGLLQDSSWRLVYSINDAPPINY